MQISDRPTVGTSPAGPLARLRANAVATQSVLVFGASMVLSVAGFVFQAIASRRLGVDAYGSLYALLQANTIVGVIVGVSAPVIARYAAEFCTLHDDAHVRGLSLSVARAFGIIAALVVIAAFAFMTPLAAFLHVPTWSVPFAGVLSACTLLAGAFRAIVQGMQDFVGYAASLSLEGILKVVALVAFVIFGVGLFGGITSFVIGSVAGIVVVAARLVVRYRTTATLRVRYDWRRMVVAGFGAAATTIALTLFGSADVVLVKHFFTSNDAGLYAAAALCGKILLYFVGFVPTVLLPQATSRHVRGERTRYALGLALLFVAIVAVFGLIAMKFFGVVVLHALVGEKFAGAETLLAWYSTAMVCVAFISLLTSYGIATHRLAFALPLLLGSVGTLTVIAFVHTTLAQVVHVLAAGTAITALAVALALALQGMGVPKVARA